jgi:hypothetical protein
MEIGGFARISCCAIEEGANSRCLDSLFGRAQAIKALLRDEASTVDDICEHPSLSEGQELGKAKELNASA